MIKKFSMDYRPEIESGKYELLCMGHPVEILKWDRRSRIGCSIVGIIKECEEENIFTWTEEGKHPGNEDYDLNVVTDEIELNKLEEEIMMTIHDYEINKKDGFSDLDSVRKHYTRILNAAKEQLHPTIDKALVQSKNGALCEMPMWKQIEADCEYPLCLTREMDVNGDWHYCISSGKIYDGCQYILLAELEQLKIKGQ